MLRPPEQIVPITRFHDSAPVHDHDLVRHVGHDPEIMGNQEDGHVRVRLKFLDQVQDLRLRSHVEGRGRLVGDKQGRFGDEHHRDHGALPQAAGQLEGVCDEGALRIREADPVEHVDRAFRSLGIAHTGVDLERLRDLIPGRVQRRQGRHRLLEDHGDTAAAKLTRPFAVLIKRRDVQGRMLVGRIVEQDAAARDARHLRQDAHDRLGGDRLAGAGLAHDRQGLAARDGEGKPVDGLEDAEIGGDLDRQVTH